MSQPDFRTPLAILFREVYEGKHIDKDYTLFVQGGKGIFNTLEQVTAEQASKKPSAECSSIFAHLNHARHYLSLFMAGVRGEEVDLDWDATWAKQTCTEEEWAHLAKDMRREYEETYEYIQNGDLSKDEDLPMYALGELAHAAFHLGAVRSIMKIV